MPTSYKLCCCRVIGGVSPWQMRPNHTGPGTAQPSPAESILEFREITVHVATWVPPELASNTPCVVAVLPAVRL